MARCLTYRCTHDCVHKCFFSAVTFPIFASCQGPVKIRIVAHTRFVMRCYVYRVQMTCGHNCLEYPLLCRATLHTYGTVHDAMDVRMLILI